MPSIAIIGASKDREKFGNKAVRAYAEQGFVVYPINPHEEQIEGLDCYASILEVPDELELASLYVKPDIGLSLVPELVHKKVDKVYINPGAESDELVQALQDAGITTLLQCSVTAIGKNPSNY